MSAQIIGGILAGLVVAGMVAFFTMRRLYLFIPRLFSYSNLSDQGAMIELNLLNKGFMSEEQIQVALKPTRQYRLVSSTVDSVVLDAGIIKVPRLSSGQEVSIVLLVEGGEFTPDEIVSATSKDAKAQILKNHPSQASAAHNLIWLILVLLLVVAPSVWIGSLITEFDGRNVYTILEDQFSPGLDAKREYLKKTKWENFDKFFSSGMYRYFPDQTFPIEGITISRNGDTADIHVSLHNATPKRLEFSVRAFSPNNEDSSKFLHSYWNGVLFPDEKKEVNIQANVPTELKKQAVVLKITLQGEKLLIFSMEKVLTVE